MGISLGDKKAQKTNQQQSRIINNRITRITIEKKAHKTNSKINITLYIKHQTEQYDHDDGDDDYNNA